jgi:hypothetical protein
MTNGIVFLTFREQKHLKWLIDKTIAAGLPLAHIYNNHPRYTKSHVLEWARKFANEPQYFDVINSVRRALITAKRNGKLIADILPDFPDINSQKIYRINKDLGIFPVKEQETYSQENITKILNDAARIGTNAAARKHGVSKASIIRWNKSRTVYEPQQNADKIPAEKMSAILTAIAEYRIETGGFGGVRLAANAAGICEERIYTANRRAGKTFETKQDKTYSEEFILGALNTIKRYNERFCTRTGVRTFANKNGITTQIIYKWNKKRGKIFPTERTGPATLLMPDATANIVKLAEIFKTVTDISRATGHVESTVKNILEQHGYKCTIRGIKSPADVKTDGMVEFLRANPELATSRALAGLFATSEEQTESLLAARGYVILNGVIINPGR